MVFVFHPPTGTLFVHRVKTLKLELYFLHECVPDPCSGGFNSSYLLLLEPQEKENPELLFVQSSNTHFSQLINTEELIQSNKHFCFPSMNLFLFFNFLDS